MITIFDLDYTLFDAKRFREEGLAEFFELPTAEFVRYYQEYKEQHGHYSVAGHIRELVSDPSEQAEMLRRFEGFLSERVSDFLYPGAAELLEHFRKRSNKLILSSFGDKHFQELKLKHLKVAGRPLVDYFDETVIEEKNKAENERLAEFKGEEVLLINDNARESLALQKMLGDKCELCLLDGPYTRNVEHEHVSRSLDELVSAIELERQQTERFFKIA